MKRSIFAAFAVMLLLFTSCSYDITPEEEPVSYEKVDSALIGEWYCSADAADPDLRILLSIEQVDNEFLFIKRKYTKEGELYRTMQFSVPAAAGDTVHDEDNNVTYTVRGDRMTETFDNSGLVNSYIALAALEELVSGSLFEDAPYDSIPHIGMPESQLNSTTLGPATEVEKCKDFYKLRVDRRVKTYKWYVDGEYVFTARVEYWDYVNDRAVAGYVSYIWEDPLFAIENGHGQLDTAPYEGMRVTKSQLSRWNVGGIDYSTFPEKTRKYTYNIGNISYQIWLYGDYDIVRKVSTSEVRVHRPSTSTETTTAKKNEESTTKKKYHYEPDVEDFDDPEDFYYEYWDDFFDYEDAEDYYYEHGGR